MSVAILGAGISGLSCAITLEKAGITPEIFEKRSCPGDRFVNAEAMFSVLNRPSGDTLDTLSEKYGIVLHPIDEVNKLVIHSKNETGAVEGKIGHTNIRGRHENSFESQLARQVKSEIHFHSTLTCEEAVKNFDHVILATGDGEYAMRQGNYRCDLTCTLKGATVEGTFVTDEPHVWFNYEILPKGYAWVIPFSGSEANVVIAFPDYPQTKIYDLDKMWELFFDLCQRNMNQRFRITDRFEVRNYVMGICQKPQIGNLFYAGNCFGAISPGLGFGQYTSILTGVYAAQAICEVAPYEDLVQHLFENYNHSLALRQFIDKLDDDGFDRIARASNVKLIETINTHVFGSDSNFDLLKWLTPFLSMKR